MRFKKLFLVLEVILLSGILQNCSTSLYIPNDKTLDSKESIGDLRQGRAIYINKCGNCHTLYLPDKYSTPQWRFQTTRMAVKAKLNTREKELILRYLTKDESSKPLGSQVK